MFTFTIFTLFHWDECDLITWLYTKQVCGVESAMHVRVSTLKTQHAAVRRPRAVCACVAVSTRLRVTHQLEHHGHALPCGQADVISSVHQTLVALQAHQNIDACGVHITSVCVCVCVGLYLVNKVDLGSSVDTNSDCRSHCSVHA